MRRERLFEIIYNNLCMENNWVTKESICKAADAIIDSGLFCNSPKAMDEQEPHVYKWTAVEDDGYTHSEYGVANNMFDAFIEATEHSPSYHKKVIIEKIPDNELTEELKEFYKDVLCHNNCEEKEND